MIEKIAQDGITIKNMGSYESSNETNSEHNLDK